MRSFARLANADFDLWIGRSNIRSWPVWTLYVQADCTAHGGGGQSGGRAEGTTAPRKYVRKKRGTVRHRGRAARRRAQFGTSLFRRSENREEAYARREMMQSDLNELGSRPTKRQVVALTEEELDQLPLGPKAAKVAFPEGQEAEVPLFKKRTRGGAQKGKVGQPVAEKTRTTRKVEHWDETAPDQARVFVEKLVFDAARGAAQDIRGEPLYESTLAAHLASEENELI